MKQVASYIIAELPWTIRMDFFSLKHSRSLKAIDDLEWANYEHNHKNIMKAVIVSS